MGLSPMMKQYLKIKEQYKDVILLYRLGDFYEMFFDDAKVVSRELELTLTGRDCGLDERAPMCGVPYHAADTYIAKLIERGFKVAICEQTTTPEQGKGIVEREVVRVITAGTVTDPSMLADDKNNYLAGVYYEDRAVGVSWVDITTGEFSHAYIEAPIAAKLNDLLSRIKPSEIICNYKMLELSLELSIVKFGSVCPFSGYSDDAFEYENALALLKAQINEDAIKLLQIKKLCVNSAGALLNYINSTQKRSLDHIKNIKLDDSEKFMRINSTAMRTLELTENMQDGGKKGTLFWLLNKTSTNMGKRMLRKMIEQPSLDPIIINSRLDSTQELQNDIMRDILLEKLNKIYDIERLTSRISYGNALPKDCLSLAESLRQLPFLKETLSKCKTPLLKSINEKVLDFHFAEELIRSAIDPETSNSLKDGGVINKGFDTELDEYLSLSRDTSEVIARLEMEEKEETGIRNLKIGFNNVFGYYIEVPKAQINAVPYRYSRKQTIANGERYITEELKTLETKILSAKEKAVKRENELYIMVVQELKKFVDDLLVTANAIASLDCLISNARCAKEYGFVKPVINETVKNIKIQEGRHCVVEKLLKSETFVPNDTFLNSDSDKLMVITGPNMAGKSVYMKQVALIVIMAHMGSFVPAKYAEISLTDRVFTRVGANDDLSTGRSTFMVEMSEVSDILQNATNGSLILLDEIGRGTSTYDGLSIAWSIIEYLSKDLSAKTLFSTHYHELTELEGQLRGVKNYKMSLKEFNNNIIFLRKLMRGSANRSFGIEVAGLAGLPKEILDRAKELLKILENADIGRQAKMSDGSQLSFFNSAPASEISAILRDLDIDSVSPRQALEILADLKEKALKH